MRWTRTGLGRYLDGLLHAMASQLPGGDRLTVYYNSTPAPRLFDPTVRERSLRIPTATAWNQVRRGLIVNTDCGPISLDSPGKSSGAVSPP